MSKGGVNSILRISQITFTVDDVGEMRRLSLKLQTSSGWDVVSFHTKSKRW